MWPALRCLVCVLSAFFVVADVDSDEKVGLTLNEENWKREVGKCDTFVMVFMSTPVVCDAYHTDCTLFSEELQAAYKSSDRKFCLGFYFMQQKEAEKTYRTHQIRQIPAVKLYKDKGGVPLKYIVSKEAWKIGNEKENADNLVEYAEAIVNTDSHCPVLKTKEDIEKFMHTDAAVKVVGQIDAYPEHKDFHAIRTLYTHNLVYELGKGHDLRTDYACIFDRVLAKEEGIQWDAVTLYGLAGQKAVLDGSDGKYKQVTETKQLGQFIMSKGLTWEHKNQQQYDRIQYNNRMKARSEL